MINRKIELTFDEKKQEARAIKFDDKKSEIIDFKSSNTLSIDTIELSNITILKFKSDVK